MGDDVREAGADLRKMMGLPDQYDPFSEASFIERVSAKVMLQLLIIFLFSVIIISSIFQKYTMEHIVPSIKSSQDLIDVPVSVIVSAIVISGALACIGVICGRAALGLMAGGLIVRLDRSLSLLVKRGPIGDKYIDFKIFIEAISLDGDVLVTENLSKSEFAHYCFKRKTPTVRFPLNINLERCLPDNENRLLKITVLYVHEWTGIRVAQFRYLDRAMLVRALSQNDQDTGKSPAREILAMGLQTEHLHLRRTSPAQAGG
ncbi:hypothetical protein [Nitrospirillum sp. BR 11163]|uniref:hypothetical protein n=1 Tax=Nitrospirillum sp. BR 11163 TaxID=3104323 RepID=UPI002AFDDBCF|nr:hypothetical protein [Nitrospirillum sp. BR 11163]MEA1676092.1 hypothetical protein [Nitrospirillum sp. BR 11163]